MKTSICSYSFYRMVKDGKQDMFQYITDCNELGVDLIDPWSGYSEAPGQERGQPPLMDNPDYADDIDKIKTEGDAVEMPFGCVALDRAHIYEPIEANRQRTSQWLDVTARLGGTTMRIDTGPRVETWTDDEFQIIVAGYNDLIAEAKTKGVQIIVENHWGPTKHPENTVRTLEAVKGLGRLFDSNNWAEGTQEKAWDMCAKYATFTHFKTFSFDENGDDPSVDLRECTNIL
jgi:sugar phosphate isomerase/epimerase